MERSCTYPGYSDPPEPPEPVIKKYRREGDFLVDTKWGSTYRILQNSPDGLIAVSSIAKIEPNRRAPSIATFSVMLEKETRRFMFSVASLNEGKTVPQPDLACKPKYLGMWYLLQSSIIFAVVASNIHWQWTPSRYLPALLGIGLAYLATLMVQRIMFKDFWRRS